MTACLTMPAQQGTGVIPLRRDKELTVMKTSPVFFCTDRFISVLVQVKITGIQADINNWRVLEDNAPVEGLR